MEVSLRARKLRLAVISIKAGALHAFRLKGEVRDSRQSERIDADLPHLTCYRSRHLNAEMSQCLYYTIHRVLLRVVCIYDAVVTAVEAPSVAVYRNERLYYRVKSGKRHFAIYVLIDGWWVWRFCILFVYCIGWNMKEKRCKLLTLIKEIVDVFFRI